MVMSLRLRKLATIMNKNSEPNQSLELTNLLVRNRAPRSTLRAKPLRR